MIIVDSHQHPGPMVPQVMEQHGIDVSVLLPVGGEELRRTQQMASEDPHRYVPFFWIDVGCIALSIEALKKAVEQWGCRGIKFQTLIQHCYANDQQLYPVYEACCQLGLVVLFHCGAVAFSRELGVPHLTKYAHPIYIDEVAFDFPQMPIILAHMGGNYFYEALIMAEKHDNILLDTAYLPFFCQRMLHNVTPIQMIKRGVDVLGPERILYGYEGLAPSVIERSGLPEADKALILGLNAARLFGIDQLLAPSTRHIE